LASLAASLGCRSTGEYIWVDAVPKALYAPVPRSAIGPGDLIGIRVWNQEANSVDRIRVREDGKIAMPLLGDVEVAGMEPGELARRLEVKLKALIVNPAVTVVVHERRPVRVSVIGQVTRPGVYEVEPGSGVIHALASAGGLTPFARGDAIFLLRPGYWANGDLDAARIRFRYRDLAAGRSPASVFRVLPGDCIVVE
jgi:polysaccharide export outer membrane protein